MAARELPRHLGGGMRGKGREKQTGRHTVESYFAKEWTVSGVTKLEEEMQGGWYAGEGRNARVSSCATLVSKKDEGGQPGKNGKNGTRRRGGVWMETGRVAGGEGGEGGGCRERDKKKEGKGRLQASWRKTFSSCRRGQRTFWFRLKERVFMKGISSSRGQMLI